MTVTDQIGYAFRAPNPAEIPRLSTKKLQFWYIGESVDKKKFCSGCLSQTVVRGCNGGGAPKK